MNIEKHPRCLILPDEEAGDEGEEDAGDQLEEAVEPHVHPVQHVVVRRQLQLRISRESMQDVDKHFENRGCPLGIFKFFLFIHVKLLYNDE